MMASSEMLHATLALGAQAPVLDPSSCWHLASQEGSEVPSRKGLAPAVAATLLQQGSGLAGQAGPHAFTGQFRLPEASHVQPWQEHCSASQAEAKFPARRDCSSQDTKAANAAPQRSCQDCGKLWPGFRDKSDGKCYCSECWLAFYGSLPPDIMAATAISCEGEASSRAWARDCPAGTCVPCSLPPCTSAAAAASAACSAEDGSRLLASDRQVQGRCSVQLGAVLPLDRSRSPRLQGRGRVRGTGEGKPRPGPTVPCGPQLRSPPARPGTAPGRRQGRPKATDYTSCSLATRTLSTTATAAICKGERRSPSIMPAEGAARGQASDPASCKFGGGTASEQGSQAKPAVPAGLLPEDAPRGHPAHSACRYGGCSSAPWVRFKWRPKTPQYVHFQTTIAAVGGSRHAAEVISRACYMKFEAGMTKDQVLCFRGECYARLRAIKLTSLGPQQRAGSQERSHLSMASTAKPAGIAPEFLHGPASTDHPPCTAQAAGPRGKPPTSRGTPGGSRGTLGGHMSSPGGRSNVAEPQLPGSGPGLVPAAPATRSAPIVVRSSPYAASPSSQQPCSGEAALPAWVSMGYLQCFLDNPSAAPPALAPASREDITSAGPPALAPAPHEALAKGTAPAETVAPQAAPVPACRTEVERPALPGPGILRLEELLATQPRWPRSSSDRNGAPGRDESRRLGVAPALDGLGPRPAVQREAQDGELEECSQPTPQLTRHAIWRLRGRAGSALLDPTPLLDEATPCGSQPTPQLSQPTPPLLPPQPQPLHADLSHPVAEVLYRPTPFILPDGR